MYTKTSFRVLFSSVLILSLFTACSSYKIKDQVNPSLSLLIIKTNIPDGFAIERSSVINKKGNKYQSSFIASKSDNINNKLMVFDNVEAGEYKINTLYAETAKQSTSYTVGNTRYTNSKWNIYDFIFNDSEDKKKSVSDKEWFNVEPFSITYGGDIAWFKLSTKDEVIEKVSAYLKKSKKDVEKSIILNFMLKTPKTNEEYFMLRLDDAGLIGEKDSLRSELATLQSFRKKKKSDNKIWDKMIEARILELSRKIAAIPEKKK
jgi:hypothetical protein